jgi:hypothetical protein
VDLAKSLRCHRTSWRQAAEAEESSMTGPEYYEFVAKLAGDIGKSIAALRPIEPDDVVWTAQCITRELETRELVSEDLNSQAAWFSQTLLIADSEMMPKSKNQGSR